MRHPYTSQSYLYMNLHESIHSFPHLCRHMPTLMRQQTEQLQNHKENLTEQSPAITHVSALLKTTNFLIGAIVRITGTSMDMLRWMKECSKKRDDTKLQ